ncbi:DUF3298 and DUF4163 domain-containing protein [Anaerocolumna aminovalerica]|uniref:DUF3298 and DUF4163 domain-containing protein n=1 Tax=Anaerocolumna aminovalerica TaxID=1527 RepID=UPI001C0EF1C0|nr:DUF3298 and DUF4163 domain-containing protein [Anaerocolumna aminovalerica]MBU5331457.1 DUF3298 and DUF4163 domain-containing protein [Anaerocolumna aminovalerica]
MKKLYDLKNDYLKVQIPDELEFLVKKSIMKKEKNMKRKRKFLTCTASVAAAAAVFVGTINISPVAAQAMSNVPVLKDLVKVVTFREYHYEDDSHELDIKVPQINGLENSELEDILNDNYIKENEQLYKEFMEQIGNEDNLNEKYFALYTDYEVKTNTDNLLVVANHKTEIAASGYETVHYNNIDKQNKLLITLPSLFKDDSYIELISENIKSQMKEQMKADEDKSYFLENDMTNSFTSIKEDQNFYINSDGKLIISFDEYEVAPGYMGIVEFTIPTNVLQDVLESNYYIK